MFKLNLETVVSRSSLNESESKMMIMCVSSIKDEFSSAVDELCSIIGNYLSVLDSTETEPVPLLKRLISSISAMDLGYIRQNLDEDFISKTLQNMGAKNMIESDLTKITPKNEDSCYHYDVNRILTKEELYITSDIQYILSLNAYKLPFIDCSFERSRYEHFFNVFIQNVIDRDTTANQSSKNTFLLLQTIMGMISILLEININMIECIFEIINVIHSRLRTSSLNIDVTGFDFADCVSSSYKNLIRIFNDPNLIFKELQGKKLIKSIDDERHLMRVSDGMSRSAAHFESINWISKIGNYSESLRMAVDIYSENCSEFKSRLDSYSETESSKLLKVIITKFEIVLVNIFGKDKLYFKMYEKGVHILEILDKLQSRYPKLYSSRSSRSGRSPLNVGSPKSPAGIRLKSRSENNSPRTSSE